MNKSRNQILRIPIVEDRTIDQSIAIKKIKDTFLDIIDAKRILREIKLLHHLHHPDNNNNIIILQDIMIYPPNSLHFDDIYLVTNLMESDLDRIIKSKQILTDRHYQFF